MNLTRFMLAVALAGIVTFLCPASLALDKYVTPTGAGAKDGSDWANAYSNVQDAVDACIGSASTIYLKSGTYVRTTQLSILNAANLAIRGGYTGAGLTRDNSPSVFTRNTASLIRIVNATNSTLVFDSVTVSNGYLANLGQGGGLWLQDCQTTLTNCVLTRNGNQDVRIYGGAIYVNRGTLTILNSTVSRNGQSVWVGGIGHGGALYALGGADVTLQDTVFSDNTLHCYNPSKGGCLHMTGGDYRIVNCTFTGNRFMDTSADDGVISLESATSIVVSNCVFRRNSATDRPVSVGSAILIIRGTCPAGALITDCTFTENHEVSLYPASYAPVIWISANGGSVTLRNSVLGPNGGRGILKSGNGTLAVTNCLIVGHMSDGLKTSGGSTTVSASTLADNGGFGIQNTATLTLDHSIVWGNLGGGVDGTVTATYSDTQNALAGTGNFSLDPRFVAGYYLSTNGLPHQAVNSPCVDAGNGPASAFGLNTRTTRTDGTGDGGTIDLGYHYRTGVQAANLVLYVNPGAGVDSNDGRTPGAALKTLTNAMGRAVHGTTVNLATGTYNSASGETFPITISQPDMRLIATNRSQTIINAGNANRMFFAVAKGQLWLEGMTLTNGLASVEPLVLSLNSGGAAALLSSRTTITNCLFAKNGRTTGVVVGGAIHANRGTLRIFNSVFSGNGLPATGAGNGARGGAIYLLCMDSEIVNTQFQGNQLNIYAGSDGGAIYASAGQHRMVNCQFTDNIFHSSAGGGLLHFFNTTGLVLTNSLFSGNTLNVRSSSGVVMLSGTGPAHAVIDDCVFTNNLRIQAVAYGNAVYAFASSGSLSIRKSTFIGNKGQGITKSFTTTNHIQNCLIYGQESHGIQCLNGILNLGSSTVVDNGGWGLTRSGGTVNVTNCIVWGNTSGGLNGATAAYTDSQEVLAGTGNLNVDPQFKDAASRDYTLLPGSPCINAGINESWMNAGVDLAGSRRITAGRVDLGAYESLGIMGTVFMLK